MVIKELLNNIQNNMSFSKASTYTPLMFFHWIINKYKNITDVKIEPRRSLFNRDIKLGKK